MKRSAVVLLGALVAAFAVMGAAATLGVTSKGIDSFTADQAASTIPADTTPPTLNTLQMFDVNLNGKVDRVVATFSEPLRSSTSTSGWTLANTPSNGSLLAVDVTQGGMAAVLTMAEGSGNADTSVGSFTAALAVAQSDVKDLAGNTASFPAQKPADKAAPALRSLTIANGGQFTSRPERSDKLTLVFTEPLDVATLCPEQASSFSFTNVNNDIKVVVPNGNAPTPDKLTVTTTSSQCTGGGIRFGEINLGRADYVSGATEFWGTGSSRTDLTWDNQSATLTVTLGGKASGSEATAGGQATAVYDPHELIADPAGNVIPAAYRFTAPSQTLF